MEPGAVRGIGCFSILWLGFMAVFTGFFAFGADKAKPNDAAVFVLFIAVFWVVGLAMLYFWLRGRFGK